MTLDGDFAVVEPSLESFRNSLKFEFTNVLGIPDNGIEILEITNGKYYCSTVLQ